MSRSIYIPKCSHLKQLDHNSKETKHIARGKEPKVVIAHTKRPTRKIAHSPRPTREKVHIYNNCMSILLEAKSSIVEQMYVRFFQLLITLRQAHANMEPIIDLNKQN